MEEISDIQEAKNHIERILCWLMDRGFSPEEGHRALKEVAGDLQSALDKNK